MEGTDTHSEQTMMLGPLSTSCTTQRVAFPPYSYEDEKNETSNTVLFERTLVFADDAAREREQHSGAAEILLVERSRLLNRGPPPFRIEPEFVLLGGLNAPGGRSEDGAWTLLPRWHVTYSWGGGTG